MRNNDVGELSLVCVSALSQALQLLEVGKVGVLSFGTEVREICPLGDAQNHTMTVRELMKEFGFNEESTSSFSDAFPSVIHKCGDEFQQVSAGDDSRGSLALIITDGRFDKDRCRPYVQELIAQGHIPVLIVMDSNKDESILSVTSVTFEEEVENGNKRRKLVRKPFLSQADCPFPFYAVIQEPSQLPSTLSDILKQWIEISHR
jgi:midasin